MQVLHLVKAESECKDKSLSISSGGNAMGVVLEEVWGYLTFLSSALK